MLKYKENLCTNMTVYDCKVIHLLQPAYEKKINHLDGCSTVGLYVEEWIGWELQILIMFQSIVILIYDSIPPFRASSVQQNCDSAATSLQKSRVYDPSYDWSPEPYFTKLSPS